MNDTIVAISTPYGTGGISIIRMSGTDSFNIAEQIFKGKKKISEIRSHTINYGKIIENNEILDEVMITKMKSPNTFTKEDVIEINCHGGFAVVKNILELTLKFGARIAEPGEFTKRAFLNGRIDLLQAESVIDIINSKTKKGAEASIKQLSGCLSDKVKNTRSRIIKLIAHIEASVDYPEYDIEEITRDMIKKELDISMSEINHLINTFETGRLVFEGVNIAIIGQPNVGKSSLLNKIIGKEKAIVTNIPGTTRDVIEDYLEFDGIPIKFCDTAGLRTTENEVEKIGIIKTKKEIENSDIVIFMIDSSIGISNNDFEILDEVKNKNIIFLINKVDLITNEKRRELLLKIKDLKEFKNIIEYSTVTSIGNDELINEIKKILNIENIVNSEVLVTNIRHKDLITQAKRNISNSIQELSLMIPIDILTIELKNIADCLGKLTGETVNDDILNEIFSRFCIGK